MKRSHFRTTYLPVLMLWFVIAIPYTLRTPDDAYTHDFLGHVQYTQFLHLQGRLPQPGEGAEAHQPPLYYLIASRLACTSPHHVLYVRLLSVLLGAFVLFLLESTLRVLGFGAFPRLLSLTFLATTPHFLFIFSTYNNDALAVFWGVCLWALFVPFVEKPSRKLALGLGIASLAGFFTKFSFVSAWFAVGAAALYLKGRGRLKLGAFNRCLIALAAGLPLALAWMFFHNYQRTGHWALIPMNLPLQRLPHSPWETVLTPPGFTSWEWVTPFTDHSLPVGKKNSLTAYLLASSVFGEHAFHQIQDFWLWFIFWVHTVWLAAGLMQLRRSRWLSAMGIAVGVGWLAVARYVLSVPFATSMDFRYIAWVWVPLLVLQTQALEHPADGLRNGWKRFFLTLILLCVLAQWAMITLL